MIQENEATISQLEHMIDANIDFDRLFSCKYLQIRFGRLPTVNVDKLKYYGEQNSYLKFYIKEQKKLIAVIFQQQITLLKLITSSLHYILNVFIFLNSFMENLMKH